MAWVFIWKPAAAIRWAKVLRLSISIEHYQSDKTCHVTLRVPGTQRAIGIYTLVEQYDRSVLSFQCRKKIIEILCRVTTIHFSSPRLLQFVDVGRIESGPIQAVSASWWWRPR
jgi:hypothetical protein